MDVDDGNVEERISASAPSSGVINISSQSPNSLQRNLYSEKKKHGRYPRVMVDSQTLLKTLSELRNEAENRSRSNLLLTKNSDATTTDSEQNRGISSVDVLLPEQSIITDSNKKRSKLKLKRPSSSESSISDTVYEISPTYLCGIGDSDQDDRAYGTIPKPLKRYGNVIVPNNEDYAIPIHQVCRSLTPFDTVNFSSLMKESIHTEMNSSDAGESQSSISDNDPGNNTFLSEECSPPPYQIQNIKKYGRRVLPDVASEFSQMKLKNSPTVINTNQISPQNEQEVVDFNNPQSTINNDAFDNERCNREFDVQLFQDISPIQKEPNDNAMQTEDGCDEIFVANTPNTLMSPSLNIEQCRSAQIISETTLNFGSSFESFMKSHTSKPPLNERGIAEQRTCMELDNRKTEAMNNMIVVGKQPIRNTLESIDSGCSSVSDDVRLMTVYIVFITE